MDKEIIKNSSDFIFIYEAIQCNPNGDPDQENKPRMDYDTNTNLVTDVRVKRFIRDYLKGKGYDIFVDMEGERQVTMDKKLEIIVEKTISVEGLVEKIFAENAEGLKFYKEIIKAKKNPEDIFKSLKDKKYKELNIELLKYLIKDRFFDIRAFGSAFAIEGFNKSYTGPIQMNWGYSFNKVELIDSSSIVTIMNEDSSTFGKDYRVHYSLIGFNGTINHNAAISTGLSEEDLIIFRDAIWNSIPANPTRSKLNQYPKLYLEIIYNKGVTNGQYGDLRNYVEVKPKNGITEKEVRKYSDLEINFDKLSNLINKNEGNKIKDVKILSTDDIKLNIKK